MAILKLDKHDEDKEIKFELDYLASLTTSQRFEMMFTKTRKMLRLLKMDAEQLLKLLKENQIKYNCMRTIYYSVTDALMDCYFMQGCHLERKKACPERSRRAERSIEIDSSTPLRSARNDTPSNHA